ncbi:PstS family phosphate ABC transporter substrate-binding protein [Roseateles sp.]|uniref:PstS family phosphate ABC transporter substrate-binding protein n=1 Tax=Roseateles sp. TaxID=1971397 RepID=UPI00286A4EFC|nr:PstS family phosphate ABC transporter substrate-binding protein [Roseateles sp.]
MTKKIRVAELAPLALLALGAAIGSGGVQAQTPRDYISIVGSSTVFPFSTVVAEQFSKAQRFKPAKLESTGSGGGIKLFCAGVGEQYPDIANSSRPMTKSEMEICAKNGVTEVAEIKIGYDGISVAHASSAKPIALERSDLWLALAKHVPDPKGQHKLVANPYKSWKEINPQLPNVKIEVYGPPSTSGTRDAFTELVMDVGCNEFPVMRALKTADSKGHKPACQTMREDGAFVEAGENDNLIVKKLAANPHAFGIFGFSFLDQNRDKLQGVAIEGIKPGFEAIASTKYPVSRPLFFYVKKAHVGVIPGIREYVIEFTSEKSWGPEGYLSGRGLIPMPEAERKQFAAKAASLAASPR